VARWTRRRRKLYVLSFWNAVTFAWGAFACAPSALPAGHSLGSGPPSSGPPERTTPPPGPETSARRAPSPDAATTEATAAFGDDATQAEPVLFVPPEGREYGPKGPVALESLSSKGHWLAYCQPTSDVGQTSSPPSTDAGSTLATNVPRVVLVLAWAERSQTVDALLRADDQGRYVVVLIQDKAWLLDTVEDARWDLSAFDPDLRSDGLSEHRSFAFTEHSLLILTNHTSPSVVQAIDLVTLKKDHAPRSSTLRVANDDVVYRLETNGPHAHTVALPPGSTTRYWPAGTHKLPPQRCVNRGQRFDAFGRLSALRPDPFISHHFLYLPGPAARETSAKNAPTSSAFEPAPGFVFGFQDGWVRRLDDGRLMLVRGKTQKQITSARCGGRILHADEASGRFVVACEEYQPSAPVEPPRKTAANKRPPPPPKYRFELYALKPGHVVNLHADIGRTGVDVHGRNVARFLPLRPGAAAALVDLKQARLHVLEGEAKILGQGHAGVLIRRGNALTLWPGPTQPELPLEHRAETWAQVLENGAIVAVAGRMFDLNIPHRTWTVPEPPLAITETGHALYARRAPQWGVWADGPFILIPPP